MTILFKVVTDRLRMAHLFLLMLSVEHFEVRVLQSLLRRQPLVWIEQK